MKKNIIYEYKNHWLYILVLFDALWFANSYSMDYLYK